MASSAAARFSYRRLKPEGGDLIGDDDEDYYNNKKERVDFVIRSRSSWFKIRRESSSKRRFKLKIPSLRRLILRKKLKVVSAVRVSCAKVVRRLKESQTHFGDLFAGNYLFLHINPASVKSIKSQKQPSSNFYFGLPPRIG